MEEKLKYIFRFFGITDEEIDGFLVNDIGVFSIEDFKKDVKAVERLSAFLNINKDFIYGNSDNLLVEKDGFYKRNEKFCEEILNNKVLNLFNSHLYIVSQKIPNKEIDEANDDNYFYLIGEGQRELFNSKKIKIFEVFNTSGCRWGYWRCRWELKKFLLCIKKNHFINKTMGIIDENILEDYSKFLKGKIKFEKMLGNVNIWYPEDYIEFKYENMNAKEEDELEEIVKETLLYNRIYSIREYYKNIEENLRDYLVNIYEVDENKIKCEYSVKTEKLKTEFDLVLLNNKDKIDIIFEIKIGKNKKLLLKKAKEQLLKYVDVLDYKPSYVVIVFPYENDFDFYIYSKEDNFNKEKFNLDIGTSKDISFIKHILNFLYQDGKISKIEAIEKFYFILSNFFNNKNPNSIDEKIVYRYLYLIRNIKTNQLITEIINFDKSLCKSKFICFKEEFLRFLNEKIKKENITFENFQPDFINLNFNEASIYQPTNIIEKFVLLLFDFKQNHFYDTSIIVYDDKLDLYFGEEIKKAFIVVKENEYDELLNKIKNKIFKKYYFDELITNYNEKFLVLEYDNQYNGKSASEIVVDSDWNEKTKTVSFETNINICECKNCIKIRGIKNQVLNFDVIQGFITLKDLKTLKIKTLNIQREIDKNHINSLKDYIQKGTYKFLPNIIFGLEQSEEIKRYIMDILNCDMVEICLNNKLQEKLKIIDGNHRFNALKQLSLKNLDELFIGFTIILFNKEQFAPIFYTLNSKMKPLSPEDYVNFINFLDKEIEILTSLKEAGLLGLENFENIKNFIRENELVNQLNKEIDIFILKLSEYFEKKQIDLNKYNKYFENLLKFAFDKKLDIKLLRNIFQSVFKEIENINLNKEEDVIKYLEKEFDGFLEFIQVNKFEEIIKKDDEIDLLFETYKKTYIPKSRKIYLSMPYHIHEDLIYFVIKDVVREVSDEIKENIELIRTDKRKLGIHKQIENKIY